MVPAAQGLTLDARISETLDRIYLSPRGRVETHALMSSLRLAIPGAAVHRSVEGPWLSDSDAGILQGPLDGLDVRWTPEARRYVENRHRIGQCRELVRARVKAILEGGSKVAHEQLRGTPGLEGLDDHQLVNVAAMTVPDGFGLCVFDEQGAGKTVTAIFAFDVLVGRDEVDLALVLAPKSMVPEWQQDFHRFKKDIYHVQLLTGSRAQKKAGLRSGADVLVSNYETAITLEDEITALLRQHQGRVALILDESFHVKNLDARRTRAVRRLREWCNRAFVLCGTPAPNSPRDLVQQFNIVDFGSTFSGLNISDDRSQAAPVVQDAIEQRGLYVRHLKVEVLPGLPIKRFHRILVPLQPRQKRVYTTALTSLATDLRQVDDLTFNRQIASFLARRSALLQVCSNPSSLVAGYSEVPAKLVALDGLLEELIGVRKEKVVLWSFYTASLQAAVARYRRFNPVQYDGTIDDVAARRAAVKQFQEDDRTMLFVANPAAAGAGITLHRARVAIFESMSNQAAHYLQSLDRIHRRGQKRDVDYMVLLCDGTIEVSEYDRLVQKERSAQSLLGDQVDQPITRTALLREAEEAGHWLEERAP